MDHLKKLEQDEKMTRWQIGCGNVCRIIFVIIFALSLLLVLIGVSAIALCICSLFMIGFCQPICNSGKKLQELIQNYKLYAEKLQGKQKVTVDDLAACVFQPSNVVLTNLDEMSRREYIKVQEGADYYRYAYIRDTAIQLPDAGRIIVVVTCDACGGVNRIPKDKTGVCEYCGSEIHS